MSHRTTAFVGLLTLLTCVPIQAATINITPVADVRILSFFPDTNEALGALLHAESLAFKDGPQE